MFFFLTSSGDNSYLVEIENEGREKLESEEDDDYDTPPPPPVPPRSASSATSSSSGGSPPVLRRVDYVLVYRTTRSDESNLEAPSAFKVESTRAIYEEQLKKEGLVLAHVASTVGNEYAYVHIYAPWETVSFFVLLAFLVSNF